MNAVGFQCLYNGFLIYQGTSCKIQYNNTRFHQRNRICSDHSLGAVHQRYMNGDVVTLKINLVNIGSVVYISGKLPCCFYRNKRVITVYFHAKGNSCICYQNTDGSKTDDTQFLSFDLTARKLFLLLLGKLLNLFVLTLRLYPVNTSYNISGCQQKSRDHQLFYTICIGTRCIEDCNTLLRAFSKRNIIYSCSCSSDHAELLRQVHVMHDSTSYQHCIRILNFICFCIISVKILQSDLCNRIQAMILIHPTRSPLQISS